MNKEQQEEAKVLLQATLDILTKCDKGVRLDNVLEVTAIWDGTECDGYCLKDEIDYLLNEIK